MDVSICRNFATRGFQFFILLQFFSLLVTRSLSQPWPNTSALGIHIDEYDRFGIAITNEHGHIVTFARGYFDGLNSSSVSAILLDHSNPPQGMGMIWTALEAEGDQSTTLLQAALEELQTLPSVSHDSCVIVLPKRLPGSKSLLVASLLKTVFGCAEAALCVTEHGAILTALDIRESDVDELPVAIVTPNGSTCIVGEDGDPYIDEVLPPPFDLDQTLSNYTISKLIIVGEDGSMPFGQTYGPSGAPIQYEHPDIITRGATYMATAGIPQQPVELLWLPIGVVLHSSLSHIVLPRHSILPIQANVTVTTVHDGQSVVAIELRHGGRPRVEDTHPLTNLVLGGIPPAPAGTPQIQLSAAVDKWEDKVTVEAVEPLSGVNARKVVVNSYQTNEVEVLKTYEEAWATHRDADEQLRSRADEWMLKTSEQHEHAIQLFKEVHRHEEL